MLNKLIDYFSLKRATLGGSKGVKHEFVLFTGVLLGAVGQWLVAKAQQVDKLGWSGLGIALIASIVVFPTIYYKAGLNEAELSWVKWCVAFQNGYFWPTLVQQIGRAMVGPGAGGK